MTNSEENEIPLSEPMRRAWLDADERSIVYRKGDVVLRATGEWASTVHQLLRHLEDAGFEYAPRVVGSGFSEDGRETLSFIEGEVINPKPWSDDGVVEVASMLRKLHQATSNIVIPGDAIWPPFFGRDIGSSERVIGHCDFAPWNIVSRDGIPSGLIDWEYAGPIDPLVELAQACWLNVRLFSDDIAEREGLAGVGERAHQLGLMVDAYGLSKSQRMGFFELMLEFVVHDTAFQADEANVTPDSSDTEALWGLAWRARSAAWMLKNRAVLEKAIRG